MWIALLFTVVGVLATLVATFQSDLFYPSRWNNLKAPLMVLIGMAGIPAGIAALLLAVYIVERYQKTFDAKFKRTNTAALRD